MTTPWARLVSSSRILDVIVIAVTLGTLVPALVTSEPFEASGVRVVVVLAGCALLGARERLPVVVLVASLAVFALTGVPTLAMLATGTLAERHGDSLVTLGAVVAGLAVTLQVEPDLGGQRAWLVWGAVTVLPAAVGLTLARRRVALASAVARADRLEAAQVALQEQARRDERARIAREMQDVVAHQVSLIALHAGGLELQAAGQPAAETAALIRQTARQALEELRSVVEVLRTDSEEEWSSRPALAAIDDMVARWRAAGLDVRLADRTPPELASRIAGLVGRTVYRVVEESLTNASKHAAGSPVDVTLAAVDDELEVTVHNGPPTGSSWRAATGSGTGLYGLRERAELLGGALQAHADDAGGFTVHMVIPLPEQAT